MTRNSLPLTKISSSFALYASLTSAIALLSSTIPFSSAQAICVEMGSGSGTATVTCSGMMGMGYKETVVADKTTVTVVSGASVGGAGAANGVVLLNGNDKLQNLAGNIEGSMVGVAIGGNNTIIDNTSDVMGAGGNIKGGVFGITAVNSANISITNGNSKVGGNITGNLGIWLSH